MRSILFVLVSLALTFAVFTVEVTQHGFDKWLLPLLALNIVCLLLALQKGLWLILQIKHVQSMYTRVSEASIVKFFQDKKDADEEVYMAMDAIKEIGLDSFPGFLNAVKNNRIKNSLLSAHEKISTLRKKERETNFITLGVAAVTGLKHDSSDVQDYAKQVINSVTKSLNARQGGFFMLRDNEDDQYFELMASYASARDKEIGSRINLGEGLVGQVYYEKKVILIEEVPKDYIKIISGLGESVPGSICIVPVISEGKIYGAIEVASFEKLQAFEVEYLQKIGEVVGDNLTAIDGHRRTEQLLSQSQSMAREVKSREEELRENMEQLTSTQEQMRRKQTEMDAVLASLSAIELDENGMILEANEVFQGITGYKDSELNHKRYTDLIPMQGNDRVQYDMMWNSLMSGKTFSGEFRILNRENREVWMTGNFTPLLDRQGKPYKVMVTSLFTTQEKEKLIELQEMMAALKNCFPIVEINPDMTFRSANELFLTELGIKRLELKKLNLRDTFHNGSFKKVEDYFLGNSNSADNMTISLRNKNGEVRPFNATLARITGNEQLKKGILILKKLEQ